MYIYVYIGSRSLPRTNNKTNMRGRTFISKVINDGIISDLAFLLRISQHSSHRPLNKYFSPLCSHEESLNLVETDAIITDN